MSDINQAAPHLHRRGYEAKPVIALEWAANIFLWIGGATMAIFPELAGKSWLLFVALFIGQAMWGVAAWTMRKWSLLATSIFFCLFNIYGVIVRF